jgi:4-alpha-glucanotransferase
MAQFRSANSWIEDSALFDALRQQPELAGTDWWEWPDALRFRKPAALKEAHKQHAQQIDEFVAVQFLFDRQWRAVKVRRALLARRRYNRVQPEQHNPDAYCTQHNPS